MTYKEKLDAVARMFIIWNLIEADPNLKSETGSARYLEVSSLAKILTKKMEVFQIPIKIPTEALVVIELCAEGNPGIAQLMLKQLIGKDRAPETSITPTDFVREYQAAFPIVEQDNEWNHKFYKLWEAQKDPEGKNLCDTREWWMECFEGGTE